MSLTDFVFVYGSLMKGHRLHAMLADGVYLCTASTRPIYRLYDCGDYPGLVDCREGGRAIKGELYQVNRQCLARLDQVEGVADGLYSRRPVELSHSSVKTESSGCIWAYFYLLSTSNLPDCGESWP